MDTARGSSHMALVPLAVGRVPAWAYCVRGWWPLELSEIGLHLRTCLAPLVSCSQNTYGVPWSSQGN